MTKNEVTAVNLGDLSQPISKLIESVQSAIGTLYEPRKIRKLAKANAEASIIEAKTRLEISDIEGRAFSRLNHQELVRQKNIESIIEISIDNLPDSVSTDTLEQEWMMNFFDCCQNVSRSSMQSIWAKILAGEVAVPGSFSMRTLSVLKTLQKNEAEMFSYLAQYAWKNEESWVIVSFDRKDNNGFGEMGVDSLNLRDLITLQTCGLTEINIWDGYKIDSKFISLEYFDEKFDLELPLETKGLSLSNVNLTVAGQELLEIIYRSKNEVYKNEVLSYWSKKNISVKKCLN